MARARQVPASDRRDRDVAPRLQEERADGASFRSASDDEGRRIHKRDARAAKPKQKRNEKHQ